MQSTRARCGDTTGAKCSDSQLVATHNEIEYIASSDFYNKTTRILPNICCDHASRVWVGAGGKVRRAATRESQGLGPRCVPHGIVESQRAHIQFYKIKSRLRMPRSFHISRFKPCSTTPQEFSYVLRFGHRRSYIPRPSHASTKVFAVPHPKCFEPLPAFASVASFFA